jgi:hypothetical protein
MERLDARDGTSMDVRIERQARGIVHAVPQPASGPPPVPRASATTGDPQPALFDANGDGVIENWSIAHGGDSFANFHLPPIGTAGPPDPKSRHGNDALTTPGRGTDHGTGRPTTPAAVHHAHDAYQRDGLGSTPPASTPAVATPAPVATPPLPAPTGKSP